MTPVTNILTQLVQWSDERFISSQPHDKNGYICNVVSELGEYLESKTQEDTIDAIADIIVFSITELPKLGYSKEYIGLMFNKVIMSDVSFYSKKFDTEIVLRLQKIVDGTLSEPLIFDILNICFDKIESMNYDVERVLAQTFLELDSRRGAWNEDLKKWKKFTDEHHKSLWVKADYTKAKL